MARKGKQTQQQQSTEPDMDSMLPASMTAPDPEPVDDAADKPIISPEDLAALRQQINDLTQAQTALIRQSGKPAAPAPVPGPQLPKLELNLDGLPDPAQDAPGFLKGLSQRMGTVITQAQINAAAIATAQANASVARNTAADDAWDLMKEKHPEIAASKHLVAAATQEYIESLGKRGINAQAFLESDTEQFVEDVATGARKMVERVKGLGENNDGDGEPADSLDDAGRTQGIPGGGAQGTGRGGKKAPAKPALFTDEIKAAQKELGMF